MSTRWFLLAALLPALAGCRTAGPAPGAPAAACPGAAYSRDWERFPALVEIEDPAVPLFAVGDVHGMLAEFQESLQRAGLVRFASDGSFEWTGGRAVLVQTGDLINKGPRSLAAIDFALALEEKAAAAGGRAIFLAGNHEVGFLAKAGLRWYAAIGAEARERGLALCAQVHSPGGAYGAWLRTRPAAAMINGVYFSHSGNSQGLSRAEIERFYRQMVDSGDWGSKRGCGDPGASPALAGFFNADVWWGPGGSRLDGYLSALGVRQAVFGNDPQAFRAKGALVGTFADPTGRVLIKLDVGTVRGDSRGALLRCTAWLPAGGCAGWERLANPKSKESAAAFEPLPVSAQPPPQDEPAASAWVC